MLTRFFRFLDPTLISPDLAPRLRRLADDCEQLKAHGIVTPQMLRNAPLLEAWTPALTPEGLHLVGRAFGLPVHGDRTVMTSQLWWADPEGQWMRSLSRFYRLGSPINVDDLRGPGATLH
jgi:hypothetical protein